MPLETHTLFHHKSSKKNQSIACKRTDMRQAGLKTLANGGESVGAAETAAVSELLA